MNIVPAIISALSFYFLPIFIGLGLTKLIFNENVTTSIEQKMLDIIKNFALGALFLYIQILLISFAITTFSINTNLGELIPTIIILNVFVTSLIIALRDFSQTKNFFKISVKSLALTLFLLLIATAVYTIWRLDAPTFTTLNWDIYHHQTLSNLISKGEFAMITSQMSDSFQFATYSTIFHTLLAIPQRIFSPQVLEYWWFLEFFHLLAVSMVSYAFAYSITKSRGASLLTAVIGTITFEAAVAYTSLFLIPQNLAALVAAAFIADLILNYPYEKKKLYFYIGIFSVFIFLNHLVIGSISLFIYLFSLGFLKISKEKVYNKYTVAIVIATLSLIPLLYYFAGQVDLNSLNRGEAEFFNHTIYEKFLFMRQWYGYFLLAFLPVGYLYAFRMKSNKALLLVVITTGVLSLILAPIPYSLKFFPALRYALNAVLGLGVWFFIRNFSSFTKFLSVLILTISLFIVFILNISDYKVVPSYQGLSTHVTLNEIEASNFLKQNYTNKNVLLVSDPATMHILEGISGVNTPGGAYTSRHTRETLTDIYLVRDGNMRNKIFTIKDDITGSPNIILFAVTGRFQQWQLASEQNRYGIHWNVWQPQDLSPKDFETYEFIYYLKEILEFEEVYRNEGIIIFELRKPLFSIQPSNH